MRISSRTIYGLQALFEIALHAEGISGARIAEAQGIPAKFLEQILTGLKKQGLVKSFRGRSGGYVLTRQPKEISLLDAIEALEGSVSLTGGKGTIKQALKSIEDKMIAELKSVSLGGLVKEKIKKEKISLYSI